MFGGLGRFFDERLGLSRFARSALDKVFPDNWSFMLGEISMYSFLVLIVTGVYLTFFFAPSSREVTYQGRYAPLRGVHMSEAYRSTVRLSFDVRAGLVFRQIHHWAALVFAAAVVTHLCRIFFTGAFRRPREINWVIGVAMLVLVIFNGFAGYSLPDDLLSGTGLRVGFSLALSIPVVGTWLAFGFFGGNFPAESITSRLYILHVLLIPALLAGLLGAHLAILWRQKHTQFPGPRRREGNVVGSHLWPTYTARSIGLLCALLSLLCLLGGLAQINPVWLYGPFKAPAVSTAAQPDWYMGWLEGAFRLFPPWRIHLGGYTISEVFWPGVVLPGLTFGLLGLWPWMERRVTGDRAEHHLLDRPWDRPVRTSIGVGVLAFYIVLFLAGSQDILAQKTGIPVPTLTTALRITLLVLPLLAAGLAWKLCRDLAADLPLAEVADPGAEEAPPDPEDPPSHPPRPTGGHRAGWAAAVAAGGLAAAGGFLAGRRRRGGVILTRRR